MKMILQISKRVMKIRPFSYDRADTCPLCGENRSVEAYTVNDKPVQLTLSIDRKRELTGLGIKYLKCRSCKSEFFPMWLHGCPYPMIDINYSYFMNGYIQSLKASETV